MPDPEDFRAIRGAIAAIPGDLSNDAVGAYIPKMEDIYAPESHAAALDPSTPIIVGSRGAGKSFWSGVLGNHQTREAAAKAYPKLGLGDVIVGFGFTGIGGPDGIGVEELDSLVPIDADSTKAKAFWWATILRSIARMEGDEKSKLFDIIKSSGDFRSRDDILVRAETTLRQQRKILLIVYDALDVVATTWPRRRMLTEALLEVVWGMRAYRNIKAKLFLRPDQIDDDTLRFVELPKLRTGAVRLSWSGTDLYGLLYARLALTRDDGARRSFGKVLAAKGISEGDQDSILARRWPLSYSADDQAAVMELLAGRYMSPGPYGYKKGKTYDWPLAHLADAFDEVTPRSFLGLMVAAAKTGAAPHDRSLTPDGIRHGLREASKTRVDQLHQEFPWIKGVLAPLAGLLLPQKESEVFKVWRKANTVQALIGDAHKYKYLPPFPSEDRQTEKQIFEALRQIGVMFQRKDDRIDMPDLFRVASKLLKKGGTAPL